jgi:hypothetical protein
LNRFEEQERVFNEPWEAQAFAMAVKLHERGAFTWGEWTETLGAEIKAEPDRPYYDPGSPPGAADRIKALIARRTPAEDRRLDRGPPPMASRSNSADRLEYRKRLDNQNANVCEPR